MCWKKATVYAIGYQGTGRILLAKFRSFFLEAETIDAEAICKYFASTSLVYCRVAVYLSFSKENDRWRVRKF